VFLVGWLFRKPELPIRRGWEEAVPWFPSQQCDPRFVALSGGAGLG
jgi:hypothetical protein